MSEAGGVSTVGAAGVPLLERDRELEALARLVGSVTAGEGRLAIVEGAAGIGKTRLLGELRRRGAEAGLQVLSARGGELEREFAFGVVRQLFEGTVSRRSGGELLDGAAAPARVVFGAAEASLEGDAAFAVLHGLYWLTVNLSAERPVLLAIDD